MLANISASGLNFNIFKALFKLIGQSIHSKLYDSSLDSLFALIFLWPGVWAAVTCMSFLCLFPDLLCNMMIQFWVGYAQFIDACYGRSAIWKNFTWIQWSLTIDMRLKRMDFNSKAFICQVVFFVLIHDPPVDIPSHWQESPTFPLKWKQILGKLFLMKVVRSFFLGA